jgi:hypothetical protein
MTIRRTLTDEELKKFGTTWSWSARAKALVNQQKATWATAGEHYRSLRQVETRVADFGSFRVLLQHNPGRILSSAANTAASAVAARPCFLCEANRPAEQVALPWSEGYLVLTNPYPIFPYHLTIPAEEHIPQHLEGRIHDMLRLARDLNEFTLFYNGPRCGASAPDHFHFQAGLRDFLPVEEELDGLLSGQATTLHDDGSLQILAVEHYLRRMLCFRGRDAKSLEEGVTKTIALLPHDGQGEPMMNLLTWYSGEGWTLLLFPRALQRPWQYFAEDEKKIVVSPAAVELGGVVILPRNEDFLKITPADLVSVFDQVTLPAEEFCALISRLKQF